MQISVRDEGWRSGHFSSWCPKGLEQSLWQRLCVFPIGARASVATGVTDLIPTPPPAPTKCHQQFITHLSSHAAPPPGYASSEGVQDMEWGSKQAPWAESYCLNSLGGVVNDTYLLESL